ncbi:MAG TPA: hypothetical protein VHG29_00240 [Novosphingobium sp.]|nr:hypothetical protein [Novosphingobium sp.]
MRRSLVLVDETARHPFLASLAPHVRRGTKPLAVPRKRGISAGDVRDFLMAYCACFIAASAFIA